MKKLQLTVALLLIMMISCTEKGAMKVELNQGYSEFTVESEHKEVKSVDVMIKGNASCEVSILVSKQVAVDTIGIGALDFKKTYPWRAGPFKVKVYSPRCKMDESILVEYAFNR